MKKSRMILLVAALVLLLASVRVLPGIRADVRRESRAAIREAVLHAAVECYAVEGAYPGSLSYLEEKYGLTINHQDFIVTYEVFASNLLPEVQVLVRGEG